MSPTKHSTRPSVKFTIRSIFVITTVFAAAAVSLGYLFRGANGKTDEIGYFVIVTMVMPLALMVAMSWGFRMVKWLESRNRNGLFIAVNRSPGTVTDIRPENDSWFLKTVHRRSKAGIAGGALMTIVGLLGGGLVQRGLPIGGATLVGVGVFVVLLSTVLLFVTKPR